MRKDLLIGILIWVTVLAIRSYAAANDNETLQFHASFNGSVQAEVREGMVAPKVEGRLAFTAGIEGKAVLVGGKDRVIFPAQGIFHSRAGTLMLWVAPQDWMGGSDNFQFLVTLVQDDGPQPIDIILYKICKQPNLALLLRSKEDQGYIDQTIPSWFPGQWHHLAAAWNDNETSLYVDGRFAGRCRSPRLPAGGWKRLILGIPFPGWAFLGEEKTAIDELVILDRALSADQIAGRYTQAVKSSPILRKQADEMAINLETDLALAGRGTAVLTSSFADYNTYYSDNVIDGDLGTSWRSFTNDFPHWIELRWDYLACIDRLVVHEVPPSQVTTLSVQSADASGHWQAVTRATEVNRNGRGVIEVKFPAVKTNRLRLNVEANRGPFTQLAELEAYGPQSLNLGSLKPYYKGWHIWYPEPSHVTLQKPHYLRKTFNLPAGRTVTSAFVQLYTNDSYEVFINGKSVAKGFKILEPVNVAATLRPGTNVLAVIGTPSSEPGWLRYGLICDLTVNLPNDIRRVFTDDTWRITAEAPPANWMAAEFDDAAWKRPVLVAKAGCGVWGRVYYWDYGAKEQIVVGKVEMPQGPIRPGDNVTVRLHLRPTARLLRDYALSYELGEKTLLPNVVDFNFARAMVVPAVPTSRWPVDQDTIVDLPVSLPDYAPHGSSPLRVEGLPLKEGSTLITCGGDGKALEYVGSLFIRRFETEPKCPAHSISRVTIDGSKRAFCIDGKTIPPLLWTYSQYTLEKFHLNAQTGVHVYRVMAYPFGPCGDPKIEDFVGRALGQQIEHILRIDSQGRIIVFLDASPMRPWVQQHPEECLVDAFGRRGPASYFSRAHEQLICDYMRRMIRYLQGRPYAGAIIGYSLEACGAPDSGLGGSEQNVFEKDRSKITIGDYNPQAIEAYRQWLRQRYANSVDSLRKAWKNTGVTFEAARPQLSVLTAGSRDGGVFRDPAEGAAPFDYYEFLSGALFRFSDKVGAAVRQETAGSKITGIYYGYDTQTLCSCNGPGLAVHSNNFDQTLSLSTGMFDYYSIVPSYNHRLAGTQLEFGHTTASMDLHGKLYMTELDTRTFTADARDYGRQRSLRESVEVLKRDLGTLIIDGRAAWICDWSSSGIRGAGYFVDPDLLSVVRRGQEVYQKALSTPRKRATDIGVFVSDKGYLYGDVYPTPAVYNNLVVRMLHDQMAHIGAPYDTYRIQDLANPAVQNRYKLYVFINAFVLDDNDLRAIEGLRRDGKTLLWFYAPGYVRPGGGLGTAGMARATGIKISALAEKRRMKYRLTDTNHPITRGLPAGKSLETQGYGEAITNELHPPAFGPVFFVEDPQAQVLAVHDFGKPALAVRDFGIWRSVYCAVPYMDAELLRGVAAYAGVHLYTGVGPVVRADERFLMVHNGYDCPPTLQVRLPKPCRVTDLFSQRVLAEHAATLNLPTPTVQTYFLELGP